jgi:hypothetical protein
LHSDNGSLGATGTNKQAHASHVAAVATAPAVAPHLGLIKEKHGVIKDVGQLRGFQVADHFPEVLATPKDEYRVHPENGRLLLQRKRSWSSSLISSDGSVQEEYAYPAKIRAVLPPRDTACRSTNDPGLKSDLLASLSSNEAASMPKREISTLIVRGGDSDTANVFEPNARLDMELLLKDNCNADSYNYSEILAEEADKKYLSPYQCELRKNLELFEADREEVKRSTTPGRKGKVALGQVGLRCFHCAQVDRSSRSKGAVNYSCTVEGVYQIAQNMAKAHLSDKCAHITSEAKKRLVELRANSIRSYFKNCKKHWGDSIRNRGIYEVTMADEPLRLMRRTSRVASS